MSVVLPECWPLLDDTAGNQTPAPSGGSDCSSSAQAFSPQLVAGRLSSLTLSWFSPLVSLAGEREHAGSSLDHSDLYPLRPWDRSSAQLNRSEPEWQVELLRQHPSLVRALAAAYGRELLRASFLKLGNDIMAVSKPLLLGRVIASIEDGTSVGAAAYICAVGMMVASLLQALLIAHYERRAATTGMRVRSAIILLVYKKALLVPPWEVKTSLGSGGNDRHNPGHDDRARDGERRSGGIGQVTNLVSSDTDKILFLMPQIAYLWSAPLQVVTCLVMLAYYIGWAAFAGSFVMVLLMIVSSTLQIWAKKVQALSMRAKDARLQSQTQLLKIIKTIKLYAWELAVEARVHELREAELAKQLAYKMWNIGIFLSFQLAPTMVSLASFYTYTVVLGNDLKPSAAFSALTLFNVMNQPLGLMPMTVRFAMEAHVACLRIQRFLLSPEVPPQPSEPSDKDYALELRASRLVWPNGSELLRDVHLRVRRGEFIIVTGKTGSGKSGLLHALLGELPIEADAGKTARSDCVSYCAQSPWLRSRSLREIVTGEDLFPECDNVFNAERYKAVLDACSLAHDLETLPMGDATVVGDRGVSLSGGQRQRLALCRAVYRDADLFVLDDVLSAVDGHVSSAICSGLLRGPLLEGKTVVLVTHDRRALQLADRVFAVGDGRVLFDGSYDEFCRADLIKDLIPLADKEASGDQGATLGSADKLAQSTQGNVGRTSTPSLVAEGPPAEKQQRGGVGCDVYKAYFKAAGGPVAVMLYVLGVASSEGCKDISDAWLARWTNSGGTAEDGMGTYALFSLGALLTGVCFVAGRPVIEQAASRQMHADVQRALLRASMGFFDLTPLGQILNRLSEDTSVVDLELPFSFLLISFSIWRVSAIVVMCMFVGWYMILLLLPIFYIYAGIAKRSQPAMCALRRMDAARRSPIIHHFSETLAGVTTIRAMNLQAPNFLLQGEKLDKQNQAWYLSVNATKWLGIRLQANGAVLVGAVAVLCVASSSRGKLTAGVAGMALTYALRLTDILTQFTRGTADLERQMVSVERMHKYATALAQEAPLVMAGVNLPSQWPSRGDVVLRKVSARYRSELPQVLRRVSMEFHGGERVGIVGRTGCGKSSSLMVLMRLMEPEEGVVTIDGVDISTVGLHTLREKFAVIPQEPTILTGSVRFNLDPMGGLADEDIWDALEKADLKPRVEKAGGLGSNVEESGANFSGGELQLLCLARALLRRLPAGGLLILDEATSSLDAETDATIQRVIRSEFRCTTIAVAHRIDTLLDYDRIVVLDGGEVVETASPNELLAKEDSLFRSFASTSGNGAAEAAVAVASASVAH
eukprot:TRINITY_DN14676_c0_g1_i2.p1 TRINITY_DN14676_c0_g1~~TRINITY_DN14676_c0_g1_i2.p1  ORF type:complete len:1325 (-),score=217.80 TRINITY_DN14676_c0_g1_i2:29-4003(-)